MEDLIISIISNIVGGSVIGTALKGVLLFLVSIAYLYFKHQIRKEKERLAAEETEKEKQKAQAALPGQTNELKNEAETGEKKSNEFFGEEK